jgi:hypothetical protein
MVELSVWGTVVIKTFLDDTFLQIKDVSSSTEDLQVLKELIALFLLDLLPKAMLSSRLGFD